MKKNIRGQPLDVTAHKMLDHLAVELAGSEYEEMASKHKEFYTQWKDQKEYIRYRAPYLLGPVKSLLADMLTRNDVSEAEKEQIHEALVLHNILPKSGTGVLKIK